jgi:hypothetical protein
VSISSLLTMYLWQLRRGGMYPTFTIDTLGDVQKQKIAQATLRGVQADVSAALYGRIEDSIDA